MLPFALPMRLPAPLPVALHQGKHQWTPCKCAHLKAKRIAFVVGHDGGRVDANLLVLVALVVDLQVCAADADA